ncbi:MAG TPA: hypothetical protein PLA50_04720 [Bacteroidia bacterium]|nr:hypothetical protein [Bacteroidia bacterium]
MSFDPHRMVGTWYWELSLDPSKNGIFRILDDFRYLSIIEDVSAKDGRRWIPMRLWGEIEAEGIYRLRPRRESKGWIRRISFESEFLIFEADESDHREWRCRRLTNAEIPEWFASEAASALSRPWM